MCICVCFHEFLLSRSYNSIVGGQETFLFGNKDALVTLRGTPFKFSVVSVQMAGIHLDAAYSDKMHPLCVKDTMNLVVQGTNLVVDRWNCPAGQSFGMFKVASTPNPQNPPVPK